MKILVRSAIIALVLLSPITLFAKPLQIGMTKAQIAKLFPASAKYFLDKSPGVHVPKLEWHGLTGNAAFVFAEGKLLVFTWDHPKEHKEGLSVEDLRKYNAFLHALQAEWGKGKVRTSPFNPKVKESTWRLPKARASIRYMKDMVRVQLIDEAYMYRARNRKPSVEDLN